MTAKTISYTIPVGPERAQLGHYLSAKIENDFIILKFATQEVEPPPAATPDLKFFKVDFC